MISAVVLAAGAATRFGSPKQLLLLPYVLDGLRAAPVDEVVIVSGAYPVERRRGPRPGGRAGRELPGLGRSGRARASAAASPRSAPTPSAALVVLADGPYLDPRAVERVLAHRDQAPFVAATYDGTRSHPAVIARELWDRIPDDGGRGLDVLLSRATT